MTIETDPQLCVHGIYVKQPCRACVEALKSKTPDDWYGKLEGVEVDMTQKRILELEREVKRLTTYLQRIADATCSPCSLTSPAQELNRISNYVGAALSTSEVPATPGDSNEIAEWLEGLSRSRGCADDRRYWYEGVAADIRNRVWRLR